MNLRDGNYSTALVPVTEELRTVPKSIIPRSRKAKKLALYLSNPRYRMNKKLQIIPPNKFIRKMAKKVGLSVAAVRKYMRDDNFNLYVTSLVPGSVMQYEPMVWMALIKRIEAGDFDAMKYYLEKIRPTSKNGQRETDRGVGDINVFLREASDSARKQRTVETTGYVEEKPQTIL